MVNQSGNGDAHPDDPPRCTDAALHSLNDRGCQIDKLSRGQRTVRLIPDALVNAATQAHDTDRYRVRLGVNCDRDSAFVRRDQ